MASTARQATPAAGPGDGLVVRADGTASCWWAADDPLLATYHDREWGRPVRDEVRLFEKLCLEGFQAGLSWRTVLAKRDALRHHFRGFDPAAVARLGARDVDRMLGDPGIVRHRGKVEAAIANARTLLALHARGTTLAALTWQDGPGAVPAPIAAPRPAPRDRGDVAASGPEARHLASALRAEGWRYVGPMSAHAYLQSVGVIDDHVVGCPARGAPGRDG